MNLFYRPRFWQDMADNEFWLMENASPEIADRWHDALMATVQELERNPFFGRERRDVAHADIRSWLVKSFPRWVIFYAVRGDDLIFFRVVSGTMNIHALRFD